MKKNIFFLILIMIFSVQASAQLRLPGLVTDHMVLQRDKPLLVWGWASPGERVAVTFKNKTYQAQTDRAGKWWVEMEAAAAGGPYELTIKGEESEITVSDVLVGDVWLCSGQSNMEWPVERSDNAEKEIANANWPEISTPAISRKWGDGLLLLLKKLPTAWKCNILVHVSKRCGLKTEQLLLPSVKLGRAWS